MATYCQTNNGVALEDFSPSDLLPFCLPMLWSSESGQWRLPISDPANDSVLSINKVPPTLVVPVIPTDKAPVGSASSSAPPLSSPSIPPPSLSPPHPPSQANPSGILPVLPLSLLSSLPPSPSPSSSLPPSSAGASRNQPSLSPLAPAPSPVPSLPFAPTASPPSPSTSSLPPPSSTSLHPPPFSPLPSAPSTPSPLSSYLPLPTTSGSSLSIPKNEILPDDPGIAVAKQSPPSMPFAGYANAGLPAFSTRIIVMGISNFEHICLACCGRPPPSR